MSSNKAISLLTTAIEKILWKKRTFDIENGYTFHREELDEDHEKQLNAFATYLLVNQLTNDLGIQMFVWEDFKDIDKEKCGTVHLSIPMLTSSNIIKDCQYTYVKNREDGVLCPAWIDAKGEIIPDERIAKVTHFMDANIQDPYTIELMKKVLDQPDANTVSEKVEITCNGDTTD